MVGESSQSIRIRLPRAAAALGLGLLVLASDGASQAQTFDSTPAFEESFEKKKKASAPEGPSIYFSKLYELPLPGPLPEGGPLLVDGRIEIPVDGGRVASGWEEAAELEWIEAGGDPAGTEDSPWVEDPSGRTRFRTEADGRLLAQKRCKRCRDGWRKKWRLRVAGSTVAPPLVTETRVFFGALDNRVYCIKRRSGHRVWAIDVAGRVTRPLRIVTIHDLPAAEPPPAEEDAGTDTKKKKKKSKNASEAEVLRSIELLLLVPDHGSSIVALTVETGQKAAEYALPESEGTFKGSPLLTPDGKIVVARQKYEASDASLLVLSLGPGGASEDLAYNDGTPSSRDTEAESKPELAP